MPRDVLKDEYDNTQIGARSALVKPGDLTDDHLQSFQAVVDAAESMVQEGLITDLEKHRESETGSRLIDAIRFTRLK